MVAIRILRYSLVVCFCFLGAVSFAQDKYFIYLQSDNSQPFYVRLNGQLNSSTASGYVILPKLNEGDYTLNIGFPKDEFPEQVFKLGITNQNEGFLLKKLDQGWTLLNLESMALVEHVKPESGGLADAEKQDRPDEAISQITIAEEVPAKEKPQAQPVKVEDAFSSLLATVVKDSSILRDNTTTLNDNATMAASSADTTAQKAEVQEVKADLAAEETKSEEKTVAVQKPAAIAEAKDTSTRNPFVRVLMVNEADGQDMVYVNKETQDTIRLFLHGDVSGTKDETGSKIIYEPSASKTANPIVKQATVNASSSSEPQSRIIYNPSSTDTVGLTITPTIVEAPPSTPLKPIKDADTTADQERDKTARIIYKTDEVGKAAGDQDTVAIQNIISNSDCTSVADEKDFFKLRRKMAGESDNQKMVDAARRFFKSKCYTTEQIRNLSYLFLDDEGKYQFFDAAYPYVTDPDMFYKLESLLKDPYFVNRFKAMIRK